MGIIKKQSFFNSLISYAGILLGFVTTIYLYPRILEPEQYGLTRLLLSVSFLFTQFAHLGIHNITIKYFPYFQNKEQKHYGFFFFLLIVPLIGFLLFLLIFTTFKSVILGYYDTPSASLFVDYYWYVVPMVFAVLYTIVLDSYIRALYNSIPGSVVNEIVNRIAAILLLILYSLNYLDFREFMIGFTVSYLLQPVILMGYIISIGELRIRVSLDFLKKVPVRELFSYGSFVLLGGVSSILVNNIDVIMLGALAGLEDTAIYAIAFYIGSVIMVPKKAIAKIAPTLIAKQLKEKNLKEVERVYKQSSINQLIVGSLIFIGIWANLDNLFMILTDEYIGGGLVILIIGAAKLVDMATGINGIIIINSRYYRFDLYSTLFLIVFSVYTNYLLIPDYGIEGAAMATFASVFIYNSLKCIYVWYRFRMQPFSTRLVGLLLIAALVLLCGLYLPPFGNVYLDILVRSASMALLFTLLVYYFRISDEMNQMIQQILSRFTRSL